MQLRQAAIASAGLPRVCGCARRRREKIAACSYVHAGAIISQWPLARAVICWAMAGAGAAMSSFLTRTRRPGRAARVAAGTAAGGVTGWRSSDFVSDGGWAGRPSRCFLVGKSPSIQTPAHMP